MKAVITGGAGFIGSHLARQLLEQKEEVISVDNFTLGNSSNVKDLKDKNRFKLIEMDVSDKDEFCKLITTESPDVIYHLAANSDIQKSASCPGIDFKNTFSTTYSVLEAMREAGVQRMFFASTSAVYGNKVGIELKENEGGLAPISYYGGAKLASEAFISAYAYMNGLDVTVFRFPNVIGPNLTHGVIFDFVTKLRKNPKKLEILGDGTQEKPYIYVEDLVEAILFAVGSEEKGMNIYNIGVEGKTSVRRIADMVCNSMGLGDVEYFFTGGHVGWKGDVPSFQYNLDKIHQKGWKAHHTSDESVQATLDSLGLK